MSSVTIGSARHDEHGRCYHGGTAGDQTGQEVSTQGYYEISKGWRIYRCVRAADAYALANAMLIACRNDHIGYDQDDRYEVVEHGIDCTWDIDSDCSSLVRACIIYALGIDTGDFYTGNEAEALLATGKFVYVGMCSDEDDLRTGDTLVSDAGHTVIVVEGAEPEDCEGGSDSSGDAYLVCTKESPLNVRRGPGTGYSVVGSYAKGATIYVTDTDGNWAKTSLGWCCMDYLERIGSDDDDSGSDDSGSGNYRVHTQGGRLNVRCGGGTNHDIVGSYSNGQYVTVYETCCGWARTDDGWVCMDYLEAV